MNALLKLIEEKPVLSLTLLFILFSYLTKSLLEKIAFFLKSNIKYKILDELANYIYYGPEIGIEATLKLDSPTEDVVQRRMEGQAYLKSKLGGGDNIRGDGLTARLVDCRFALLKFLVPIMRELEFPPKKNFVTKVVTEDGMHKVVVDGNNTNQLLYCGNDAVHTLGVAFHEPIQKEINRQMDLSFEQSTLRFAPIALNPILEKNADLILGLTGMDQVRYCLSGSEAMDAAFKDVKSSTRGKGYIVRFSSAYHGHVSGVDFLTCGEKTIFLKECDPKSLDFIEKYHFRISAVVINPMQHFTGVNKPSPPGEKLTIGARERQAVDKDEYALWLHSLQEKCRYCTKYLTKVAFILDDIYFAFRNPQLFSKNYFSHPSTGKALQPDVLVLGKGVAAGYPLSMILGRRGYLNSYDKKFICQVNKTVGTLAAWHGGLVASNIFLEAITKGSLLKVPAKQQLEEMVQKFDSFTTSLNRRLEREDLPIRIRNFSNTFSINFLSNSLYNCRYTQYLLAEGIFLGNYSTGKFNLNADTTPADLDLLQEKFVQAGKKMKQHGYFEPNKNTLPLLFSLLIRFIINYLRLLYNQIMADKQIDIEVSHNHPVNKFGHFWSSIFMILFAYPYIYMGQVIKGNLWFFGTHVVRQSGHFFYEHQDRDIEKLKFGHKDGSKKEAAAFLFFAFFAYYYRLALMEYLEGYGIRVMSLNISQFISIVALFTVVPHYVEITYQYGIIRGLSWMLKILTDPFTDLIDFWQYAVINPSWFLDFKEQKAVYKLDIQTKKVTKVD